MALVGELRTRSARALRNWVAREERHVAQFRSRPVLADPLRAVAERAEGGGKLDFHRTGFLEGAGLAWGSPTD